MANTYVAIAKSVLTASTNSVTFSAIPATYTDLLVTWSVRGSADYETYSSDKLAMRINGSVVAQYAAIWLLADGIYPDSQSRYTGSADTFIRYYAAVNKDSFTASTFSSGEAYIINYAGSTRKQISTTAVTETNAAGAALPAIAAQAHLWENNSAITSLEFTYVSNALSTFVSGSRFDLYGIKSS